MCLSPEVVKVENYAPEDSETTECSVSVSFETTVASDITLKCD